jgi:hypothetical protein
VRQKVKKQIDAPPDRNTICTVNGTSQAKAQLFNKDEEVCTRTWKAHCVSGTRRGLRVIRIGKYGMEGEKEMARNLGSEMSDMKSICENVINVPSNPERIR